MMAVLQCFAVATTWCNEPVQLCIWPPMTMQVRDYIAATSSCPSGVPALAQGEEVETLPSPSEPHPNNEPQSDLSWDICVLCYNRVNTNRVKTPISN